MVRGVGVPRHGVPVVVEAEEKMRHDHDPNNDREALMYFWIAVLVVCLCGAVHLARMLL